MLTTEVKGILKSKSGAIPLLPSASEGSNLAKQADIKEKSGFKLPPTPKSKEESTLKIKETTIPKPLTKGESSEVRIFSFSAFRTHQFECEHAFRCLASYCDLISCACVFQKSFYIPVNMYHFFPGSER